MKVLVAQLYPTLCNPMAYSPPGSSVRGILQARTLEWVAIPFSRGSSQPRAWTWVSCIAGRFLTTESWGKPGMLYSLLVICPILPLQWENGEYILIGSKSTQVTRGLSPSLSSWNSDWCFCHTTQKHPNSPPGLDTQRVIKSEQKYNSSSTSLKAYFLIFCARIFLYSRSLWVGKLIQEKLHFGNR